MIKAVAFDIDNTLYDYDAAHARAIQAVRDDAFRRLKIVPDDFDDLHRRADALLRQRSGGGAAIHNRLIRYQLMLELSGRPIAHAPAMAKRYWSVLLEAMRPVPGVPEVLRMLKAMGLTVGIGTNMTADYQYEKLARLGAMPWVDFMVTSEEAGSEKPDARLFELCVEKAGCTAEECLFVGDSLRGDVKGALRAGMQAAWYRPGADSEDDDVPGVATFASMTQLPGLLASH